MSGRPSWKSAEIVLFRPFSAFFALFQRVRRAPGKSRKWRKKAFFLRYPQICLNPHLLNPHLRHPNCYFLASTPFFVLFLFEFFFLEFRALWDLLPFDQLIPRQGSPCAVPFCLPDLVYFYVHSPEKFQRPPATEGSVACARLFPPAAESCRLPQGKESRSVSPPHPILPFPTTHMDA